MNEKVKGVNLERFLNENYPEELKNFSLIKIDTEGYDIEIIRSIASLLKKHKPNLIFECFPKLSKAERQSLYDLVADMGYHLTYVEAFDAKAKKKAIKRENMSDWKHFDIWAVPVK
ncbi:FkbM family methyltransferase [Emticicia sp. 21SJ11W-3]|nr:FkbM family methyltransferase [Emticicia sp. 21SJ11W-3]UTA70161.1 FkbM family methyltransferase [Emticicia sp. 21SJ11W-3]